MVHFGNLRGGNHTEPSSDVLQKRFVRPGYKLFVLVTAKKKFKNDSINLKNSDAPTNIIIINIK